MRLRSGYILLILVFLIFRPTLSNAAGERKAHSALAAGEWYKIAVMNSGIHKLTGADLMAMGIDLLAVNPTNLRLFGNGGGMLPESNAAERADDLLENPVALFDGGDGRFDPDDYLLFYGGSPDQWIFDATTRYFNHQKNLYSDTTFYFLNLGTTPGKRIQMCPSTTAIPDYFATTFNAFAFHEKDSLNFIKSGKEWYGETFDNTSPIREFPFTLTDIDTLYPLRLKTAVATKAPNISYFVIFSNGRRVDSIKVDATNPGDISWFGKQKVKLSMIGFPDEDQRLTLQYKLPVSNAMGWLNYLEVNYVRKLVWRGPQMEFRNTAGYGPDMITQYYLQKAHSQVTIWDVTNIAAVRQIETTLTDSLMTFRLATDSLRQFIAFDGSFYYPVIPLGKIPNQDLHGLATPQLIIVTHPAFLAQANRLAAFHTRENELTVQVVTTETVYNEFGGGNPDATAIRDFVKFLYDKADSLSRPRYLLLIGDGSYDPKNRIPGNNNFIPTFQSTESLSPTGSFVTDDYYGILDEAYGQEANGPIRIGIGRFPVSDTVTANVMVDKIIHYSDHAFPITSDWRNTITFVADDENQNLHFHQAENVASIVDTSYPLFNLNKIYFDAYQRTQIPGGYRFPDATKALNDAVEKGSLIVNYTGHGGEAGWGYEQVLTLSDIDSWTNADKLPVFFTATCEFSRFDNPERYTAGEKVILHPGGGAVALFSTTRLAYAGYNIKLNISFFQHLMDRDQEGKYLRMGDLILLSKNLNGNISQLKNFVLLGDPAQRLAFPQYNIRTVSINNEAVNQPDTVLGLSTVTIKGLVEDRAGQPVTGFNGTLTAKVYDKPVTYSTLGNIPPPETYPEPFTARNSLLFKGDTPVDQGAFTFSFVVPKGIALQFGKGKLSYYARDDQADAAGYCDQIIVGGSDPQIDPENEGPSIALYMDNRDFQNGGRTGIQPVLLADLYDTNGINFTGLGIGHEIEAVLDHDRAHAVVLNDQFTPDFNSYTRGSLSWQLEELTQGMHTLTLKAWDLFNNSSEKEISFYVFPQSNVIVKQVMNIPNPVRDHTWFIFQPETSVQGDLEVRITIYDITGRPVHTLEGKVEEVGNGTPLMAKFYWNGTTSAGATLKNGVYPYKLTFRGSDGSYAEISQKLLILR